MPGPKTKRFKQAASTQDIVTANTKFALDIFNTLPKDTNTFMSPLSISAALSLVLLGARGNTAEEMKKAMHLNVTERDFHDAFGDISKILNRVTPDCVLRLANRLFGMMGYTFLDTFLAASKNQYGAELETLDFRNEAASRKTINDWVEKQTENKIRNLIGEGVLTVDTALVLVNAIYFIGNWTNPFRRHSTQKRPFHVSASEQVEVDMMFQDFVFKFRHFKEHGCSVLALPYGEKEDLSMVIIRPTEVEGLGALEENLTEDLLAKLTTRLKKTIIHVYIPKFKFESEMDLGDVSVRMGVNEVFTRGRADLSGMDGTHKLYISKAVHKAFVDVNEEGTEAAAATGQVATLACLPPKFCVDRPFLFLIRDNVTKAVLFLGRVRKPAYR